MDVAQALITRKSVRSFLNKSVPKELIIKILEHARHSPSGTNTQPWQVAVVRGKNKETLDKKLTDAFWNQIPKNPDYNYYPTEFTAEFKRRRAECGLLLYKAIGVDKNDIQGRLKQWAKNYNSFGAPVTLYIFSDKSIDKGSFMDCGMFIQSIMLMATSLGLGSCAQASLAEYPDIVRSHLGYTDSSLLLCAIAIGYEDKNAIVNSYKTTREDINTFTNFFD